MKGSITSYIDVAQVTLYLFWAFFAGLILYLRREDRREGYPLYSEASNTHKGADFFFIPPPKVFKLSNGSTVSAPNDTPDTRPINATKVAPWPGAPLHPNGDPMLAAVGPGSYAARTNVPDMTTENTIKIVPLRSAANFACHERDGDPRGYRVVAADRKEAGVITDIWVDRSEQIFRYLEVRTTGGRSALIPINFARINRNLKQVEIHALMANHFAAIPALANPDQVTRLEEDKICAYFGGGMLYAHPSRTEPWL